MARRAPGLPPEPQFLLSEGLGFRGLLGCLGFRALGLQGFGLRVIGFRTHCIPFVFFWGGGEVHELLYDS